MPQINKRKLLLLLAILLIASVVVFVLARQPKDKDAPQQANASLFAMNTYMNFMANGENAEAAVDEAMQLVSDCEKRWSVTDRGSEISALNAKGHAVLSDDTAALLRLATKYSAFTNGCFDCTVYPLVRAWGFTNGNYRVPGSNEIAALLTHVGNNNLSLSENSASLSTGSMVDLGGIAKGHVGDLVMQFFKSKNISSALISLGGNIQTLGLKSDGSKWRIGIQSPYDKNDLLGSVSVGECCVITSGAYERYFIAEDGTRYGHIISPFTGYPATNGLASATVVCNRGSLGDALSTALFVMGTDEAIRFWQTHEGFDVLLLSDDGTLYVSEGIFSSFSPSKSNVVKKVCEIKRS